MKLEQENKILKEIIKDHVSGTEDPDFLQTMINNYVNPDKFYKVESIEDIPND